MKFIYAAGLLSLVASAATAMPVETFLSKAQSLQAKGFTAVFSSDVKLLTDAIKADAAALKGEREAAQAAHRTPAYCPPGPVQMGQREIMETMRAVPAPARSRTDTRDALRAHLAQRFPCRS